MAIRTEQLPAAGELWLSCPPYLLTAHVVEVEPDPHGGRISYDGRKMARASAAWIASHEPDEH